MLHLMLHSLQPSHGAVNFILAQLYVGVYTFVDLTECAVVESLCEAVSTALSDSPNYISLVDTTGLILQVLVHEANIQDYRGGKRLLAPLKGTFPRLKLIWADSAYKKEGFDEWVKATLGWEVEIVEHPWSGLRGVWARHPMQ